MSLVSRIQNLMITDDIDQSERIDRAYANADAAGKALLDDVFISLCGYSLATLTAKRRPRKNVQLVENANGEKLS